MKITLTIDISDEQSGQLIVGLLNALEEAFKTK